MKKKEKKKNKKVKNMKNKMAINTYLSAIESTNKMNKQSRNRLIDRENILTVDRWKEVWKMGEKGEGIKNYKLVVTE